MDAVFLLPAKYSETSFSVIALQEKVWWLWS